MKGLWDRLLDVGSQGPVSFYEFYLRHPWPVAAVLIIIALAVGYAGVLYVLEKRLSIFRRVLLGLLRAIALATLIVLLFEPVLGVESTVKIRRNVLVLVDSSESMAIKDARTDQRDIESAAVALGKGTLNAACTPAIPARALRAMRVAVRSLEQNMVSEAVDAQKRAVEALKQTRAELEASTKAGKRVAPGLDAKLAEIMHEQNAILQSSQRPDLTAVQITTLAVGLETQARALEENLPALCGEVELAGAARSEAAVAPRLDVAKGLVEHFAPGAPWAFGDDVEVRYFRFGDKLEPTIGTGELAVDSLRQLQAKDQATRMGTAIEEALARYSGQPIAGVVLLTDGASNSNDTDPLAVARNLRNKDIPIYPVGIGLPTPDDIELRAMLVNDVVFQKDNVPVRVQINSHGYNQRPVNLVLSLNGNKLLSKSVTLTGQPQFEELLFKPENIAGQAKLELTIEPQPGETSPDNNTLAKSVTVIDTKIKVLYIEGKPRWEYRYLRGVLKRDYRLEVKFLMAEGDPDLPKFSEEYLARFPEESGEAFKFDLVILGDVPASFFTGGQLAKIDELVRKHGGSLLVLGGRHNPSGYAGTPLDELLPVRLVAEEPEKIDRTVKVQITPAGRRSMIMDLESPEDRNEARWSLVSPIVQVPRVNGAKPGATVLAELSDSSKRPEPYPLIAWQRIGSGKSMYVGTDELWRLRFKTGDKYHARFWGQTIQFLTLSRLLGGNKRIQLETDRNDYRAQDRVRIFANVLNEAFMPVQATNYTVYLDREGAAEPIPVKLEPVASAPGLYQGYYVATQAGVFTLHSGADEKDLANTVQFQVVSLPEEKLEPAMQEALLKRMAELSGGKYFTVRELPALSGYVEGQTRTTVIRKEKELWDAWPVYFLILLVAGAEWMIRRRSDLV